MAKVSVQIFHAAIKGSESRLVKTCNSLLSLKIIDKVFIIGYWTKGDKMDENLTTKIKIIRIATLIKKYTFRKGTFRKIIAGLSLIEFHLTVLFKCFKIKPDYVSCHNLKLLPLCVVIKVLIGSKLIYEPHELETEKTGIGYYEKKISRVLEKRLIRYCDKVVTVCEPISNFYKEKYNLKEDVLFTIRNVPVNPKLGQTFQRNNILRSEFSIPNESLIYIYQGVINKYRGINNYLDTFKKLSNKHHLILMGFGEMEEEVQKCAKEYSNIHFKNAVPVIDIIKYTSSADIGLFIIPGDLTLSYKYALPNKFYEYAIAGLYICVSDNFEYLTKIVKEDNLGEVISSEADGLYSWIKQERNIVVDPISLEKRRNYGWQNDEKFYSKIYHFI